MFARRSSALLIALALVTAGAAACGDDGDDDAATTTTTEATTTEADTTDTTEAPEGDETTTTAPSEDETTTTAEGATTTSPNLPPNDSPLAELLLDPATVGPEYTADDSLGDGSLDTDLCEGTTLEASWDDEAAQALLSGGTGPEAVIFQQSILRFADAAAAEAFTAELGAALVACQPDTEVVAVEGVGDEAVLATVEAESVAVAGIVRVGDLVAWHLGLAGPGGTAPVDEAILTASAERLAG